jgi:hypothetical protein
MSSGELCARQHRNCQRAARNAYQQHTSQATSQPAREIISKRPNLTNLTLYLHESRRKASALRPPNDGTERCGRPSTLELATDAARPHSLK